ncbi:MAG: OmpA family protein [Syntrophaceae bacterium]
MFNKIFYSIICMMFLLMLSNVVSAQERASTFSVTPYLGHYDFDDDQHLDSATLFGIGLGYNLTKYFGAEASGEYMATQYDLEVPHSESSWVANYRLNGILNLLPDRRIVPFVFAGVGGQHIDYPTGVSNENQFVADYGVGLKVFFAEDVALRVDARQNYIFHDSMRDNEYTAGLSFSFGGSKPAPALSVEEKVVIMASEPKVEEKVVKAAAEPKIIILAFEDVHFDFDKSTLKPEAQEILKRNIQILKDNPNAQIRIAGYTSASGTEDYNQKLSERRAQAVQEYLVNAGIITRDRLSTIGYGETRPAMHEAAPKELYSPAAKANMRVLFEIIVQ